MRFLASSDGIIVILDAFAEAASNFINESEFKYQIHDPV